MIQQRLKFVIILIIFGVGACTAADRKMESKAMTSIQGLNSLTGNAYTTARDQLLKSAGVNDEISLHKDATDWQNRITAEILSGWQANETLYKSVLSELSQVDVAQEGKSITGLAGVWEHFALRADKEWMNAILPLCWEHILKYRDNEPQWQTITYMRMIEAVPSKQSIDPVIHFMETATDPELTDLAAQVLAKMPKKELQQRLDQAKKRHQSILQALETAEDYIE